MSRHPLCTGKGCLSCARMDAELNERRSEQRDRLDRVGDAAIDRALRWLSHEKPDLVDDALRETGAPA